ncbi:hypothetical protein BKA63DRAFT_490600 [Paraphoma chrysanthemicola]|nr:hypothetical protein BKA63DRAFT_490600 [Paraphoma chrysanthemicola]
MTGLTSLPLELIYSIFEGLRPDTLDHKDVQITKERMSNWTARDSYAAYKALALSCRSLSDIALRFYYSQYETGVWEPRVDFLRKLADEPKLCTTLQHIGFQGPWCLYHYKKARSQAEVDAHLVRLEDNPQLKAHPLAGESFPNMELAILLTQAGNLQTFNVRAYKYVAAEFGAVPAWLSMLLAAGRQFAQRPRGLHAYHALHTVVIGLDIAHFAGMGYLFHLPAIRRLGFHDFWREKENTAPAKYWSVRQATSTVRTPELKNCRISSHLVACMIKCCKELVSLSLDCSNGTIDHWLFPQGCTRVLASLEQHQDTLESLRFLPGYEYFARNPHSTNQLRNLRALRSLHISFTPKMNRTVTDWSLCKTPQDLVQLRDILPPKLRSVVLEISSKGLPRNVLGDSMATLLPPLPEHGEETSLERVTVFYNGMEPEQPLPMNFSDTRSMFDERGVRFDYEIRVYCGSCPENHEKLANMLAGYGLQGVEMADHFTGLDISLAKVVMRILQADNNWLEPLEGLRLLFKEGAEDEAEGS